MMINLAVGEVDAGSASGEGAANSTVLLAAPSPSMLRISTSPALREQRSAGEVW